VTWLVAILGLLFLVLIHEAGHFYVALAVGIRPRKFYVGFPPPLVRRMRNGIEYGIGTIPLGGYVRIPGMHRPAPRDLHIHLGPALREAPELEPALAAVEHDLDADDDDAAARASADRLVALVDDAELTRGARKSAERGLRDLTEGLGADAYWRQATWRRVAVIFAGPGTNILFALGLLALVYAIGAPTLAATRTVAEVSKGTPAASAGLRSGDRIVAVNGRSTPTFAAVRARIAGSHGGRVVVTVRRHGSPVTLPPRRTIHSAANGWIFGFTPRGIVKLHSYSIPTSIRFAAEDLWQATKGTGVAIGGLFHKEQRGQLTSTVGIVKESQQALSTSFRTYLQLLAFISLALALLNLLPLLPLDGGHILFSLIEGVRRRAVTREVYERASAIGFALLMLIFFIALNNDLSGNRPG
jgi:regulator of sigma E protease